MSAEVVEEYRRKYGVVYKKDAQTGNQTDRSLYPVNQHRDMDGGEVADPNAEWVVVRVVVSLTVAGTFVIRDGSGNVSVVYNLAANVDREISGPINVGLAKAVTYSTTGGGDVKLEAWASDRHYRLAKPATAKGA